METRDHDLADAERAEREGWRVSDDLEDLPVSSAELDVIETFLMGQLRAILAGEGSQPALTSAQDSPPPQTHAETVSSRRRQGAGNETRR